MTYNIILPKLFNIEHKDMNASTVKYRPLLENEIKEINMKVKYFIYFSVFVCMFQQTNIKYMQILTTIIFFWIKLHSS